LVATSKRNGVTVEVDFGQCGGTLPERHDHS
jgi:hypothetical protein